MTPHDAFIAPARRRPQLWRLVAGIVLAALIWALGTILILAFGYASETVMPGMRGDPAAWITQASLGEAPGTLLLVLGTFGALALGAWAAARVLHGRGLRSLIGPRAGGAGRFAVGLAAILVPGLLAYLVPFGPDVPLMPGLDPGLWWRLLVPALVLVALQTGAEELAFRGYLQQQLAARFRSPLAWMIVPSVGFGLLHYDSATFGPNAPLVAAAAAVFGLIAADLTARTGSLHAAWGLHFGNNCIAILGTATPGPLSGMALYLVPLDLTDPAVMVPLIALDGAVLILSWALARWALSRLRPPAAPPIPARSPEARP
ncbi:MAG: lysostaphin resistance A-like protein [Hasllibacter sp.]